MQYYRDHWCHFGGALFALLTVGAGLWGGGMPEIQRILLVSFMALLAH